MAMQSTGTPVSDEDAGVVASATLPRTARLRARAEFDRVFADGQRVAGPALALHLLADGRPPRLGLAVSRKVDPRAVGRNRIKRALREEFRHCRARLAGGAYVVVARGAAADIDSAGLRHALRGLLQRAGALPAPARAGTMPPASPSDAAPRRVPRRPDSPAR